jgi:putative transcriptional regulator
MARKIKKEHDLVQAVREMVAHHRGELALPSYRVQVPAEMNVSKIRKTLGYSQQQFANVFGFALSALKDWEQGRRTPERSARILLAVIATNPKAVEKALMQFSV